MMLEQYDGINACHFQLWKYVMKIMEYVTP